MNINFKEWLIDEIRVSGTAYAATDDPDRQRGRDENDVTARIIKNKMGWDNQTTAIGGFADVSLKIDGKFTSGDFNGKTFQIGVRQSAGAKPDVSYKMTSRPMDIDEIIGVPFTELMRINPSKASASVDLYILRTADDDHIYICEDADLKVELDKLLNGLKPRVAFTERDFGNVLYMDKPNRFKGGLQVGKNELRLAPSRLGHSLIAYLNAPSCAIVDIPINMDDIIKAREDIANEKIEKAKEERKKQEMLAQIPDGMTVLQFEQLNQVINGTLPYFTMQVSNNSKKQKGVEKFLQKKNLIFTIENVAGKPYMKIKKKV